MFPRLSAPLNENKMDFNVKEYILKSREDGISDNVIKTTLLNLGHSRAEVEAIYQQVVGVKANESENYFTPTTNIQFGNQPLVPSAEEVAKKEEQTEQTKQKNKKMLLVVAFVALLLAGSGGGFAYYNYVQNLPANVLKKFNLVVSTIFSFRNTVKITALISVEATKQIKLNADFKGSFDFSTSTGPRTSGDFTISSQDFANFSPIGLSFVSTNKNIYLRSWDFSKFPFMDLSGLNGVWIKAGIDPGEYEGDDPFDIASNIERTEGVGDRFKEGMQNPPVKFVKELSSEAINNISTYHYLFEIDQVKAEEFIGNIGNLTLEEIETAKEATESSYPNIATSTLELWIYKGSYLPAKFTILLEGRGAGEFTDSIKIDHIFSDTNTVLTIPEPSNFKNLPEVLKELSDKINVNINESISSSSIINSSTSTAPTGTIPIR